MSRLRHYRKDSCDFTKDDGGRIISAEYSGRKINLGQKVFSNGRIFVHDGTLGIVVCIHEPGHGLTSNIFEVWFENELDTSFIKIKDLKFE